MKIHGDHGDITADMDENWIRIGEFGKEPEVIDVRTLATDFSATAAETSAWWKSFWTTSWRIRSLAAD